MLASTPAPDLRDWGALSTGSIVIPGVFFWYLTRTSATLSRFSVLGGLCFVSVRTRSKLTFGNISVRYQKNARSFTIQRLVAVWSSCELGRRVAEPRGPASDHVGDEAWRPAPRRQTSQRRGCRSVRRRLPANPAQCGRQLPSAGLWPAPRWRRRRLAAVAAVGWCERDAILRDDTRRAKPGLPP